MLKISQQQLPLPNEVLDQTLQYLSSEDLSTSLLVCKQFFNVVRRIAQTNVVCPIAEPTCLDPTSPPSYEDDARRSRVFAIVENKEAAGKLRSLRVLGRNLPDKCRNQIVTQSDLMQRQRLSAYHSERLYSSIVNATNLEKLSVTGPVDLRLKSASHSLRRVVDLKIDAQFNLGHLQNYKALRSLTIVLSETSRKGDFDTLPSLPWLQRLMVRLDEKFASRDTTVGGHHPELLDLSLLEALRKLELGGTNKSSMWSHSIINSSNSIEQLLIEDINLADMG